MNTYKVLKGIIKGVKAGSEIQLSDEEAKAFGTTYVQAIKVVKEEIKDETTYTTKQVASPKRKTVKRK